MNEKLSGQNALRWDFLNRHAHGPCTHTTEGIKQKHFYIWFEGLCRQTMASCIGNNNDKCSIDIDLHASWLKKPLKNATHSFETALKHWHGHACLVCFFNWCCLLVRVYATQSAYHCRWKNQAAIHTAEWWRRGSWQDQEQQLDREVFNLLYEPNSNADDMPPARATNVRKGNLGTSPSQWNSAAKSTYGSICPRLLVTSLRRAVPRKIGGPFSLHELHLCQCGQTH